MTANRFHLSGEVTFGVPLGQLAGVTPISVPGGTPHIIASFVGAHPSQCARLELDAKSAVELARRLPESLAALGDADCSGIFTDVQRGES